MEELTVLAGTVLDAGVIEKKIYMVQPVGSIAKAQMELADDPFRVAPKLDYALDGVYASANDANAADILGIRISDTGWIKIAVPAGSAPVMISMK